MLLDLITVNKAYNANTYISHTYTQWSGDLHSLRFIHVFKKNKEIESAVKANELAGVQVKKCTT